MHCPFPYRSLCGIQVQAGDYLGFIGTGGRLGDYHNGHATSSYSSISNGQTWPEHGVGSWNHEFYLNAHVVTFSSQEVEHTFTTPRLNNLTVSATNAFTADSLTDEYTVDSYIKIEDLNLNYDTSGTVNTACRVTGRNFS